jgi:mRNA interferase HigB
MNLLRNFPRPIGFGSLVHGVRKVTFLTLPSFARSSQPPTELVLTVFNIGGNRVRLIAAIHYNRKKVYIRAVLAHTEYDEGKWKE